MKKLLFSLPVMFIAALLFINAASAHVTVDPKEVPKDSYQKFTVKMPNEKDKPVTKLEVKIPANVDVSSVEPAANWSYKLTKDSTDKITGITWMATGKGLLPEQFAEFSILGKVSKDASQLSWKALQTYDGGDVVKWVGAEGSEHPASVTKVVAGDQNQMMTDQKSMDTQKDKSKDKSNSWPLYLSIIAILLSFVSIVIVSVKKPR